MNIDHYPNSENEFRNRFGSRYQHPRRNQIDNQTPVDYLRHSFESFGRKVTNYTNPKKKSKREVLRILALYLAFFVVACAVIAIFTIFFARPTKVISDGVHSSDGAQAVIGNDKAPKIEPHDVINHKYDLVPEAVPVGWRKLVLDARPHDVINHKYDHFAISILVREGPSDENGLLHAAVTTFLRQVNRIQIASNSVADTFIAGNHIAFISFTPLSVMFPKLERYIDGFKTMLQFSPTQEWFIQVDEGSTTLD
jgi:hypothetical protein